MFSPASMQQGVCKPPQACLARTDVILSILVLVLVVVFVATNRDRNKMDDAPEGSQANPPANRTSPWS